MASCKRAFTLLEITLVLVIISLVGGLCVFQAKKLVSAHEFEEEVSRLFITLQEAQVLSTAYQTDISLDLFVNEGKVEYLFKTDEPFARAPFKKEPIRLPHLAKVVFNQAPLTKTLHFDIYAGGRIEPRGLLSFQQTAEEESKTLWFDLQYGHLIKCASEKPTGGLPKVPEKPKKKEIS